MNGQLDTNAQASLAAWRLSPTNNEALTNLLVENLNSIVSGTFIYEEKRFHGVQLEPETESRLKHPPAHDFSRLNRLLLDDAYPAELKKIRRHDWAGPFCSPWRWRLV